MLDGNGSPNGNALAASPIQRDELSRRRFLAAAGTAGAAAGLLALGRPSSAEAAACGESCLNVKDYGATGNGTTDDSGAFQEALNTAAEAGGGTIIVPRGKYRIDSPLTYEASNLEVTCEIGAIIDFSNAPTGKTLFTAKGVMPLSGEEFVSLTADAKKGASAVSCSAGAESAFSANDYVVIAPAVWPISYPSTAIFTPNTKADGSMDQRIGEIGVVSSTSSGSIQLRWSLFDGPYLTSDKATIIKLTQREDITWRGGEIIGGGLGSSHRGFFFQWCLRVQVIGATLTNFDSRAIEFSSVLHGLVDGINVFGGASEDNFYGVSFANACQWCQAVNSTFRDCYHALNTGGNAIVPGINRFITWANNHSYDATGAAFNTHAGAEHLTIIGNTAVNGTDGILLRNPSAVVQGNTIIGSSTGVSGRNQSYRASSYVIADNRFIDVTGTAIYCVSPAESALDGTVAGEAIDGISITGNEVTGCGSTAIMVYSADPWPMHTVAISGNTVSRPGYHAIRVYNGRDVVVSANTVKDVPESRNGIRIQEAERVVVSANNLVTTASSATAIGGLEAEQCAVSGNICSGFWAGVSGDANCADWLVEGNYLSECESPYNLLGNGHLIGRNFGGLVTIIPSASNLVLKGSENDVFEISGTTAIESIAATWEGRVITLKFRESAKVVDGSNLKLAGDFNATADDTLTLMCDGTNWQEMSRSVN